MTARELIRQLLLLKDIDSEIDIKVVTREPFNNSTISWKRVPIECLQIMVDKCICIDQSKIDNADSVSK